MIPNDYTELFDAAMKARENACALYSKFKVGAALKTVDGKIYTGCNVESASYGLTICAERVALTKALSEGERKFESILIVADTEKVCTPCGACRQLLIDYADDLQVVMTNLKGEMMVEDIESLLKHPFKI